MQKTKMATIGYCMATLYIFYHNIDKDRETVRAQNTSLADTAFKLGVF
jgi:hypothetical protein